MAFETCECQECGESFTAFDDSNAARTEYCSPSCEVDGKSL
jgi:hypothetical protein